MEAFRTKQRAWIIYRDNTAESEYAELKGGTMEDYYEVTDTSESSEWKVNYIIAQDNNCNTVTLIRVGATKKT